MGKTAFSNCASGYFCANGLDPSGERGYYAGKTKAQADVEREKLFDIIRDLVKWENTNNGYV